VGATLHVDPCRIALFSFTHVNYFLLLVYLTKPQSASYERMRYADGSNIIRIDEEGKHTQVMRMQTGYEGGRPLGGEEDPNRREAVLPESVESSQTRWCSTA
jgi:hypothetical protein